MTDADRQRSEANDRRRAVQIHHAGTPVTSIARQMGRAPATIRRWLIDQGVVIRGGVMTPEQRESAQRDVQILRARGLTIAQIAASTQLSTGTVRSLLAPTT